MNGDAEVIRLMALITLYQVEYIDSLPHDESFKLSTQQASAELLKKNQWEPFPLLSFKKNRKTTRFSTTVQCENFLQLRPRRFKIGLFLFDWIYQFFGPTLLS